MKTKVTFANLDLSKIIPRDKEYTLYDAGCDRLALRIQPSGAMSWVMWMRVAHKTKRITLGKKETLGHLEARKQLRIVLASADGTSHLGLNLATFGKIAEEFFTAKADVYTPETLLNMERCVKRHFHTVCWKMPFDQIKTAKIANWFFEYSKTASGGANQTLGYFTTIVNWAKSEGLLPSDVSNPAAVIRRNTRSKRGQMLKKEDINRLTFAIKHLPKAHEDAGVIVKLMLLTGCRSGEILRLSRDEVDTDCLRLKRTKTGPRKVILSKEASKILETWMRKSNSELVFPAPKNPTLPRKNITAAWNYLKRDACLHVNLRLHDLRHTFASQAILSGETLAITADLLGHRSAKSTAVYAHFDTRHLLRVAEVVSSHIERAIEGRL